MSLTYDEAQLLQTLSTDPAYLLLMDKLQAVVDNLTDKLHALPTKESQDLLPFWKAFRSIYIELRNTPEETLTWLEQVRKADDDLYIPPSIKTSEQLTNFLQTIEKQRDTRLDPRSVQELYAQGKPNTTSFGNII